MLHPEFFKEASYEYTDEEMLQLKAVAAPWVQQCILRP
jgi:hypothetical protein